MFLYAYWPNNDSAGNQTVFQAFNREDRACEYAIEQLRYYIDQEARSFSKEMMPDQLLATQSALKSGDAKKCIEEYEKYMKTLGRESALHEIRPIKVIES